MTEIESFLGQTLDQVKKWGGSPRYGNRQEAQRVQKLGAWREGAQKTHSAKFTS